MQAWFPLWENTAILVTRKSGILLSYIVFFIINAIDFKICKCNFNIKSYLKFFICQNIILLLICDKGVSFLLQRGPGRFVFLWSMYNWFPRGGSCLDWGGGDFPAFRGREGVYWRWERGQVDYGQPSSYLGAQGVLDWCHLLVQITLQICVYLKFIWTKWKTILNGHAQIDAS